MTSSNVNKKSNHVGFANNYGCQRINKKLRLYTVLCIDTMYGGYVFVTCASLSKLVSTGMSCIYRIVIWLVHIRKSLRKLFYRSYVCFPPTRRWKIWFRSRVCNGSLGFEDTSIRKKLVLFDVCVSVCLLVCHTFLVRLRKTGWIQIGQVWNLSIIWRAQYENKSVGVYVHAHACKCARVCVCMRTCTCVCVCSCLCQKSWKSMKF